MTEHQKLAKLIFENCVAFGDFVLASGTKSDFYIDLRKLTYSHYVGRLMPHIQKSMSGLHDIHAIGGPGIGAASMTGMMLNHYHTMDHPMHGFAVRKEAKEHGKGNKIEGSVVPGDRCVLFEDVTTTGQSALDAVLALREFGCHVEQITTILDRENGAADLYKENGVPHFYSMYKLSEIMAFKEDTEETESSS